MGPPKNSFPGTSAAIFWRWIVRPLIANPNFAPLIMDGQRQLNTFKAAQGSQQNTPYTRSRHAVASKLGNQVLIDSLNLQFWSKTSPFLQPSRRKSLGTQELGGFHEPVVLLPTSFL